MDLKYRFVIISLTADMLTLIHKNNKMACKTLDPFYLHRLLVIKLQRLWVRAVCGLQTRLKFLQIGKLLGPIDIGERVGAVCIRKIA